jgi:hypothetical protein
MSALGSLVVRLALEYAEYTQGLDRSEQRALDFAQRAQQHFDNASRAGRDFLSGMATSAVGAVAAMVSVGAAIQAVSRSIDDLAALDDLAQKTGASVEALSRLQQVGQAFGQDFAPIDSAITKLGKSMAAADEDSSKVHRALKALGISAKDAAGNLRDPAEVFIDISKNLQGYEDGAAKAALVTDALGKSGADLMPFLNDAAGSVDKFKARTQEAVDQAARFQDQTGELRAKMLGLATDITTGALPAVNDLLGAFIDTANGADGLLEKDIGTWADDLGVGLARVVDVAILIPRLLSAVAGSFKAVAADVKLANAVLEYANPVGAIKARLDGTTATAEISKALAERNKVVEESNQKLADLWNKPANEMEQAYLKRLAERGAEKPDGAGADAPKRSLNYRSGEDKPEKEKSDYESLNKAVQDRLALLQAEITAGRQLSDAEKEIAKIQRGRAEGTVHLTDVEAAGLIGQLQIVDTMQKSLAAGVQVQKLYDDLAKASRDKVAAAVAEAEANERLVETTGRSKAEIEAMTLARLEEQYAQRASTGMTIDEIEELEKLIAAKKRSAEALAKVEGLDASQKGLEELNAFLDPAKAQTFGESLKEAFGSAGEAISKVTGVLDGYGKRQAEIEKQRKNAAAALKSGKLTEIEYQNKLAQLNEKETKNQLAGYGDMAGAAAGFFGEQSKGYQALMAVSKVFHAAELVQTMAELVPKGISAVLSQAEGDPYTAIPRMAAMAAIVAGLGVAIGGIGGGGGADTTAKDRQAAQGTGSVLGDATAKSDSIARSLELVADNSDIELSYTAGMLASLRSIESSLSGLGSLLVRTAGLTGELATDQIGSTEESFNKYQGFASIGEKLTGGAVGKLIGSIFGGKVSTLDTGVTIGRTTLDAAMAGGVSASQYTDTKKDGGWFHSDKYATQLSSLGTEANDQFAKVIAGLAGAVGEAGKLLGVGGDDFTKRLNSFVIDIGKISLKGMTGDEIQEALEAVFSKLGDDMAKFGVSGLDQFQKVGEGYFETLTRVASDYANVDSVMASLGGTFGAVGIDSIAARERLIDLVGGIDELSSQTSSFADNFLTEAERLAPVQKYVTEQLAAMGLQGISTRDQFKDAVMGLVNSGALATEAGAQQYAGLMRLEEAFAQTHAATEDLSKSEQEIADERKNLQDQLDEATMTSAQLLAKQRAALDDSNRALFDQVQAATQANATADERAGLQQQLDQLTMSSVDLLARQRAALDESNRALFDQVQAQTKANALREKQAGLDLSLFNLTHTAAEQLAHQRELELAALDEALRPQQQRIYALQDEKAAAEAAAAAIESVSTALKTKVSDALAAVQAAVQGEKDVLAKAYQDSMDALEERIDGVGTAISDLTSLSSSLRGALDSMVDAGQAAVQRAQAQAKIAAALAIARAGGPLPKAADLEGALNTVKSDASSQFSSYLDYQRDLYRTANDISALGDLTDSQLTAQQQMLATLEKQKDIAQRAYEADVAYLDDIAAKAQQQVDQLNGINSSVLSVVAALASLSAALAAVKAGPSATAPGETNLSVSDMYRSALGREADADGLAFWTSAYGSSVDASEMADFLKAAAPELEAKKNGTWEQWLKERGVPGYATGGDHAGGLRVVGERGMELEATGPARIWNASQTAAMLRGGGDNSALVDEVRLLRKEVESLRTPLRETADNTATGARVLRRVSRDGDSFITKDHMEEA